MLENFLQNLADFLQIPQKYRVPEKVKIKYV